jgi:hypothetical protein
VVETHVITIGHKLGKEEAAAPCKTGAEQVVGKLSGVESGGRAVVRRPAAGNVQVAEDSVRLEVTLPWLLQKFGEAVQKAISGRGRVILEKK